MDVSIFEKQSELNEYITTKPLIDMACYDIGEDENLRNLPDFRKTYAETLLMILANADMPPTLYLKPSISPDSLLLRPFTEDSIKPVFDEFINAYIERNYGAVNNDNCF